MTSTLVPTLTMNDGHTIPALGFGTYPLKGEAATTAVRSAIDLGYRLIDTAARYDNEAAVGQGIADSGARRAELFVTTKVFGSEQGYDPTIRSCHESLARLGLDYLDLYLIHWPNPSRDLYVDTWRAMIALREQGVVRSIGVSNFTGAHLERLVRETGVTPVVNQIELHPHFQQPAMRAADAKLGVLTEAWSPLGRVRTILSDPTLAAIAAAHGKTISQIALRFLVQLGVIPIPKSADPARQRENLAIFDFTLTAAEMTTLAALDRGEAGRNGGNPDTHEEA